MRIRYLTLLLTALIGIQGCSNSPTKTAANDVNNAEQKVALVIANSYYPQDLAAPDAIKVNAINESDKSSAEKTITTCAKSESKYEISCFEPFKSLGAVEKEGKELANLLAKLGFNVIYQADGTKEQIEQAVAKFETKVKNNPNAVGLVYFAGHGISLKVDDGLRYEDYLIPVVNKQVFRHEQSMNKNFISSKSIKDKLKDLNNKGNIVIMDACRNLEESSSTIAAAKGAPIQNSPMILAANYDMGTVITSRGASDSKNGTESWTTEVPPKTAVFFAKPSSKLVAANEKEFVTLTSSLINSLKNPNVSFSQVTKQVTEQLKGNEARAIEICKAGGTIAQKCEADFKDYGLALDAKGQGADYAYSFVFFPISNTSGGAAPP